MILEAFSVKRGTRRNSEISVRLELAGIEMSYLCDTVSLRTWKPLMSHLKELKSQLKKANITLNLSSTFGAIRNIFFSHPFVSHVYSNCTSFSQFLHTLLLCSTQSLSSSFHFLPILIQRSNQFSLRIDSCWYGSDYVTNVSPVN